ncbi:hypothetical protein [Hymenobacter nivis]|uniref:hypothetical protein n=1 Tax=Hymenobacter nivis TaxID=1850093 RepID=UPI001125FD14|nr:hypothetical protein [Hymenobacter nivis]
MKARWHCASGLFLLFHRMSINQQHSNQGPQPSSFKWMLWAAGSFVVNSVIGVILLLSSFSIHGSPPSASVEAMGYFVLTNLVVLIVLMGTREKQAASGFSLGSFVPVAIIALMWALS